MKQTKVSVTATLLSTAIFAVLLLALMAGCASLDRSMSSGYFQRSYDSRQATADSDRRAYEREAAQSELGPTSSERAIAYRQAVKRQERTLEGKTEREQYYKAKPYLKNDADRLQFLRLESTDSRERYLNSKGINGDQVRHPAEYQELVEQNDIAIGMTRQAVREAWGPADDVVVAGNQMYGNEKWTYSEQVTSRDGYMTEHRTVYFEGGRVVGWETK